MGIVYCDTTFFTVLILTHPVNVLCGRKPEHPEKTHDFGPTISEVKDACSAPSKPLSGLSKCFSKFLSYLIIVDHHFSCSAVKQESPYDRMKQVVKWYLSGFYKKPKVYPHFTGLFIWAWLAGINYFCVHGIWQWKFVHLKELLKLWGKQFYSFFKCCLVFWPKWS
jgi:hypothetical protein